MLNERFVAGWAERLVREVPDAVAVVLKGSYARGEPGPHSDVDFDVVVADGRETEYPAWLDTADGRLVHVSVAIVDAHEWLGEETEPQEWALGFPSAEATRLLWARTENWRARLDRSALTHPAGTPELEDLVAEFGKMANARRRRDELALRSAAYTLASLCPGMLRPLNEPVVVGTPYEALAAALALPVAPPGYREDLPVCLGLSGTATTVEDVYATARRLVAGTVALCQQHAKRLDGLIPEGLADYLADGTLARYVTQFDA